MLPTGCVSVRRACRCRAGTHRHTECRESETAQGSTDKAPRSPTGARVRLRGGARPGSRHRPVWLPETHNRTRTGNGRLRKALHGPPAVASNDASGALSGEGALGSFCAAAAHGPPERHVLSLIHI